MIWEVSGEVPWQVRLAFVYANAKVCKIASEIEGVRHWSDKAQSNWKGAVDRYHRVVGEGLEG